VLRLTSEDARTGGRAAWLTYIGAYGVGVEPRLSLGSPSGLHYIVEATRLLLGAIVEVAGGP
jgi:hypothetical protein